MSLTFGVITQRLRDKSKIRKHVVLPNDPLQLKVCHIHGCEMSPSRNRGTTAKPATEILEMSLTYVSCFDPVSNCTGICHSDVQNDDQSNFHDTDIPIRVK